MTKIIPLVKLEGGIDKMEYLIYACMIVYYVVNFLVGVLGVIMFSGLLYLIYFGYKEFKNTHV